MDDYMVLPPTAHHAATKVNQYERLDSTNKNASQKKHHKKDVWVLVSVRILIGIIS